MNDLATRKTTFVQLVDGRAVAIREAAGTYRTPDLVKNVARQWTILTWTWDSKLPDTSKLDAGQKVGNDRLTTTAYLASFLLQGKTKPNGSSFRAESRNAIAQLTSASVFSGSTRSTILISYLSEPRTVAPGRYEVDMVATRNVIDQSGQIEEIPFNRTFVLDAVDIPQSPLGKDATEVERAVYPVTTRSATPVCDSSQTRGQSILLLAGLLWRNWDNREQKSKEPPKLLQKR